MYGCVVTTLTWRSCIVSAIRADGLQEQDTLDPTQYKNDDSSSSADRIGVGQPAESSPLWFSCRYIPDAASDESSAQTSSWFPRATLSALFDRTSWDTLHIYALPYARHYANYYMKNRIGDTFSADLEVVEQELMTHIWDLMHDCGFDWHFFLNELVENHIYIETFEAPDNERNFDSQLDVYKVPLLKLHEIRAFAYAFAAVYDNKSNSRMPWDNAPLTRRIVHYLDQNKDNQKHIQFWS